MFARLGLLALFASIVLPAIAHHPHAGLDLRRVELFDWVERLEPLSYRQRYNRPRYIGGKIVYHIAPSSQEAMSWHEHKHLGSYRNHAGPIVKNFYFPKPWEALNVGPRNTPTKQVQQIEQIASGAVSAEPITQYSR